MKHTPPPISLHFALAFSLAFQFAGSASGAGTVDASKFEKAMEIAAVGYDGSSTLENFPALVRLSEDITGFKYADIGTTAAQAYESLRFADASGNALDYEIENWDATGTSALWVSIPSLSGRNTSITALYGVSDSYTPPENHPTNVWTSADYVGVWHLAEREGSGTTAVHPDATGTAPAWHGWNENARANWNGTVYSSTDTIESPDGTIVGAPNGTTWRLQSPSLYVDSQYTADWTFSTTGYSVETWINFTSPANWFRFFCDGANETDSTRFVTLTGKRQAGLTSSSTVWPETAASNVWRFVTAVYPTQESGGAAVLYEARDEEGYTGQIKALRSQSDHYAIDFTSGMGLSGYNPTTRNGARADEMRVRRGVSTTDWIQANWDTQRVGTDFLEYGAVFDPRALVYMMQFEIASVSSTTASFNALYRIGDAVSGSCVVSASLASGGVTNSLGAVGAVSAENGSLSFDLSGLAVATEYELVLSLEYGADEPLVSDVLSFTTTYEPLDEKQYRYSVEFTATGYDGSSELSGFPVLVRISDETIPGFHNAATPANIRFTDADGNQIPFEVESWNVSGVSCVWVSLPSLSGTATKFSMHWKPFGSYAAPAAPASHRVWKDAGYVGVWHLQERGGSPLYTYPNSAGTEARADAIAAWAPSIPRTDVSSSANGSPWLAVAGRSIVTNGVSDWTFASSGYSTEFWLAPAETGGNTYVFATAAKAENGAPANWNPTNGVAANGGYAVLYTAGSRAAYTDRSLWTDESVSNQWHYVCATYAAEGSGAESALFECAERHTGGISKVASSAGWAVDLTSGVGLTASLDGQAMNNKLDEMRVRRGVSTTDWIQANWDTQRMETDFLTVGEVLNRNPPTVISFR